MASLPTTPSWISLSATILEVLQRRHGIWLDRLALGIGACLWVAFVFVVVHEG
jgi:hypothetical protein